MFRFFPRSKKPSVKMDVQIHHRNQHYKQESPQFGISSLNNKRVKEKMERFLRN